MRMIQKRPFFAFRTAVLALSAVCLPLAAVAQSSPSLTPAEIAGITKDTSRHFGDAPENPGPRALDLSVSIEPAAVRRAMRKVADWQMAQSQQYFARIWTWSALYSGLMAASDTLDDPQYRNAVEAMGQKYHWQLRSAVPNADDQSVAQTYIELYLRDHKPGQIQPTQQALDRLLNGAAARIPANQAQFPWWWCDALFMAPPVWSRMYAATGGKKYLAYLDEHWWQTSKLLYDTQRHLYYRDITFLHSKGPNGQPVFWSRGNGWVMAGIARTLETMPKDEPNRPKYEQQLREMAAAVAMIQDPKDGLWHSNLLDARDYPLPETSGSALMTFALAWGVNHGILSRAQYTPVISRAWGGLVHLIYADGRLGCVQQTGAAPAHYLPSSSYTYGVGAFLLAGSQIVDLSEKPHADSRHTHGAKH